VVIVVNVGGVIGVDVDDLRSWKSVSANDLTQLLTTQRPFLMRRAVT